MKEFSKAWIRSTKTRKQRKYRANAPLHLKQNMTQSHLSKELRTKYTTRALQPKKGDTVKIMRGTFRGKTGKIYQVDLKKFKVYVEGIERVKKDGTKAYYAIDPSNILLTTLNTEGKKRIKEKKDGKKTP